MDLKNGTNLFGLRLHTGTGRVELGCTDTISGQWVHYAATYDGATMMLYRNGELMKTSVVNITVPAATVPMRLGQGFAGSLDEIRVYSRALNAAEIHALYLYNPMSAGG